MAAPKIVSDDRRDGPPLRERGKYNGLIGVGSVTGAIAGLALEMGRAAVRVELTEVVGAFACSLVLTSRDSPDAINN